MRPSHLTPRTLLTGLLLVALGLLAGCEGAGEGGDGPLVSPTRTPTATLPTESLTETPSIEVPTPTRTRTTTLPAPTDTQPTSTHTPSTPTPEEPTTPPETESPTETATPTPPTETSSEANPEPSPEPSPVPSPVPTEEASEEPTTEDEGVPSWVWWAAAALVLGCIVAVPLAVRARRRASWRQDLERQEAEVEWFARFLLPELRNARSHEEMAGGWAVSQRRATAAEDELTVLESSAPDDAGRDRARALRDASRHARSRMQHLVAPGPHDTWALDLDTIMIELEGVLRPVAPPPPTG